MAYNIFSPQNLFQHNHKAYAPGSQEPDGTVVPAGAPTQPQQPQRNVPGMDVANRIVQQYQAQQQPVQQTPVSTWHGKDATAPDGGIYSWMGRTFTTPQQEQQYRKQSRARMGIMAVADALRHLGNIYHTTQYAPSQQFNKPVEQEYAMYKANKAERDKDNYAIYQQQLAQAKWEADQAYKQATLDWRNKTFDYNKEKDQRNFDYNKEKDQRNFDFNKEKFGWQKDKDSRDFEEKKRMNDNTIRHQGVMERQGQEGLALRWANLQETKAQHAWTRQHGGAGGDGKQNVFFTGTYGSVSRNKTLSLDESVNMVNNLHRMGWVTDKKYNEFMGALNSNNAADMMTLIYGGTPTSSKGATGGIIEGVLTYHKDGAKWLQDNYNFNITGNGTGIPAKVTRVTRTPANQAAPQKPAAAPQKPAAKDTTTVKASSQTQAAAQKATTPQKPAATPQKQAAGGQKATQNGGSTSKKSSTSSVGKDGKPLKKDKNNKIVIEW